MRGIKAMDIRRKNSAKIERILPENTCHLAPRSCYKRRNSP